MVERILVTGASGTVGSEVINQLSSATADADIRAGAHSIEGIKKVVKSDIVEPIQIDYNKPDTLKDALKDIDRVFLLTPFQSDMEELSSNFLKEIENAGNIKQIVKLSVMGADSEPGIIGSRLHRQVEKMIENTGIPFTFLRPNFFMQNFVNFFSQSIKEQDAFYLPAEDGKVSFVDVRDIASVAVQVLTKNNDGRHNGKAYVITGPEAISYGDVARILSEQLRKKISYVNISEDDARKGMKGTGGDDWTINYLMELFNIIRMGYLSEVSSVTEEVTGRSAISLSQFAKDYSGAFT
ncbi:MAG: SDR family oxidoreductase [Thaumarchaeota archaeon]|nr:MAG: SDR family oxidoreductase [Nitrososphaerota archaeon]